MAKANKYPINQNPALQDLLFGSKQDNGKDQNISIEALVSLIKTAFGNDSIIYKYGTDASFAGVFTTNTNRTTLVFNKKQKNQTDLSLLFNKLKTLTSLVLKLTNIEDLNNFFALKITSIVENASTFTINTESYKDFSSGQLTASKNYSLVFDVKEDAYYSGVPNPTIAIGGLDPSYSLTGKTPSQILEQLLVVYLPPTIINFASSNYQPTVEVGTTITGVTNFSWGLTNPGNIAAFSGSIVNTINNSSLINGFNLANNGMANISLNTYKLGPNERQEWKVEGTDTKGNKFYSNTLITRAYYKRFYGGVPAPQTDGSIMRTLNNDYQTGNSSQFTLNTGADRIFCIALPAGVTISNVVDVTSSNVDITSQYVNKATITVDDIGGTPRPYTLYEMVQAIPNPNPHTHLITTT
jgi:hypothetical protein